MDPTGLLEAVLAVAVYPGALFLAVGAVLHRSFGGRSAGLRAAAHLPALSIAPVLSAVVAAAMLPLPGSPAVRLPPPTGAAGNVVAVIVLLAIAVDLGAASRRVAIFATAAALPVMALAASRQTLSVLAISTSSGAGGLAARWAAAAILVLAAASTGGGRAASLVATALALSAAALTLPAALDGLSTIASALACLGVVALSGLVGRILAKAPRRLLAGAGATASVAGTVLALVSAHV